MYSNWYAVQVRSGKEDKFVEWCEKKVNHQTYKDIFIPRIMRAKKYQGKWHNEKHVLFPGYVFVITDQVEDLFQELKKIPDLTKMLGEYKGEYSIFLNMIKRDMLLTCPLDILKEITLLLLMVLLWDMKDQSRRLIDTNV